MQLNLSLMVQLDKCATCLSILLTTVSWDGTEKVTDTRAVTQSLSLSHYHTNGGGEFRVGFLVSKR